MSDNGRSGRRDRMGFGTMVLTVIVIAFVIWAMARFAGC